MNVVSYLENSFKTEGYIQTDGQGIVKEGSLQLTQSTIRDFFFPPAVIAPKYHTLGICFSLMFIRC